MEQKQLTGSKKSGKRKQQREETVRMASTPSEPSTGMYVRPTHIQRGARCSSVVRAFAHGAMGRRIDPTWGGPIELFLVPASGVTKAVVCGIMSVGWCI